MLPRFGLFSCKNGVLMLLLLSLLFVVKGEYFPDFLSGGGLYATC